MSIVSRKTPSTQRFDLEQFPRRAGGLMILAPSQQKTDGSSGSVERVFFCLFFLSTWTRTSRRGPLMPRMKAK